MNTNLNGLRPDERVSLALRGVFEQYGYKRIKARMFEPYALYLENRSFLADERVITFTDPDGRLMALKPDVTLSLVKNSAATGEKSEKLYYIENVCRLSRENREFREIRQMGLELFGNIDAYAAHEVLRLALRSLAEIDSEFVLDLSHMGFVGALLEEIVPAGADERVLLESIRSKNLHELRRAAAAMGITEENTGRLAALAGLYGGFAEALPAARAIAGESKAMNAALDDLESVYTLLGDSALADNLRLDFSIVNDIGYYTGLIFQGYVSRAPRAVLSGGRYDKLPEKFGSSAGAIGFALYLDQVAERYDVRGEYDVDILVLYDEACDAKRLVRSVQALMVNGARVRVERSVPEGIRAAKILRFVSGALKEE